MVFIGLESADPEELQEMHKSLNLKLDYEKAFQKIHKYGIVVLGAFIFGSDTETKESIIRKTDYILKSPVDVIQATKLTPLPGTRLFEEYQRAGRLVANDFPADWDHYDMKEDSILIRLSNVTEIITKCCEMDCIPISSCSIEEIDIIREMFPGAKTVIVLAHHVKHSLEWVWFPFENERNNNTCAADLHIKQECYKVVRLLEEIGCQSYIIPYPGRCGIRFKDLADKTGLGKIGDNYLFLHREWGAWTHLRVILTDAEICDTLPPCDEVCTHCGICKEICPAGSIKENTFAGVQCNEYQIKRDIEIDMKGSFIYKCEKCIINCPIGDKPEQIKFLAPHSGLISPW